MGHESGADAATCTQAAECTLCGPDHDQDCSASMPMPGGSFNRANDEDYPATVDGFKADTTAQFWNGGSFGQPVGGAYENWDHPLLQPDDGGFFGNEDCGLISALSGLWFDVDCNTAYWYVCEEDLCPADPVKAAPGECGCGMPDTDSDGDGIADCVDDCPNDPTKYEPGDCGCADAPVAAGTACDDGLCAANTQCDGAGTCGDVQDCSPDAVGCSLHYFEAIPYWFCEIDREFADARQRCRDVGFDLAAIETPEEDAFIAGIIDEHVWLGSSDAESQGDWAWLGTSVPFWSGGSGGGPVGGAYTNWEGGHPDWGISGDCAVKSLPIGGGQWETFSCTSDQAYVCERTGDTYLVDASVIPEPLTDFDEITEEVRPVAAIRDQEAEQSEFIANELFVEVPDQATLDDFVDRYGTVVVETISFDPDPEDDLLDIHAVRIDPAKMADPATLPTNVKIIDPEADPETFRLSDSLGLGLLATWAEARAGGFEVDINWVAHGDQSLDDTRVLSRTLAEDATVPLPAGPPQDWTLDPATTWSPNPFDWVHFANGSTQHIGVAEAWRLLAGLGLLQRNVQMAVVDAGFSDPSLGAVNDYPDVPMTVVSTPKVSPFASSPDSSGPWHGTQTAMTAFGRADNTAGGAGTGYPVVSHAYLASHGGGQVTLRKAVRDLRELRRENVDITSISWSWQRRVRFSGSRMNRVLNRVNRKGMIVFASAGNRSEDVDRKKGRRKKREKGRHMPCEGSGVICVGGLAHNALTADPQSSWGDEDVDIWAPYWVVVGSIPGSAAPARVFIGTSASSPFAAGVAALIWAADRGQSREQVIDRLIQTAFVPPTSDGKVTRIVQAFDAVQDIVLGTNQSPLIRIVTPQVGDQLAYQHSLPVSWFLYDAGETAPTTLELRLDGNTVWDAPALGDNRDGIPRDLIAIGQNTLTISGNFPSGQVISAPVTFTRLEPDALRIQRPANQEAIRAADAAAGVWLLTEPVDDEVRWFIDGAVNHFAVGGEIVDQAFPPLAEGEHQLRALLDDGIMDPAEDEITFCIIPDTAPVVTATLAGPASVEVDPPNPTVATYNVAIEQRNGITGVVEPFNGVSRFVVEDRATGQQLFLGDGTVLQLSFNGFGEFAIRVLLMDDIDPGPGVTTKIVAQDLLFVVSHPEPPE